MLIAGILILLTTPIIAQFHFNSNISSQPVWGPVGYYYVQYYYLPDIDTYYSVTQHRFIYHNKGYWVTSSNLPARYRDFNLYNAHKVVINEDKPYMQDQVYREKYSSYKDLDDQQSIRDSRESIYFAVKNHPEHNNWIAQQKKDIDKDNKQVQGN
jgi:hypothetical protein